MHDGKLWLHRKILDSDLWALPFGQRIVALTCLMKANWKDGTWFGKTVKRGQWATSHDQIREACGKRWISKESVRRSLASLRRIGFADTLPDTINGRSYLLVTICKYKEYQFPGRGPDTLPDTLPDTQPTPNRHPTDTNRRS